MGAMQRQLEIRFHGIDRSEAVETYVREKVDKLEAHCDHITGCRVTLEQPHHHHTKGSSYHVRIEIAVPGDDVIITRDPGDNHDHEDIYVLLRDAFKVAHRLLEARGRPRHQGH